MRKIKIEVQIFEKGSTYRKGHLYVDGRLILSTIEDVCRGLNENSTINFIKATKNAGECAIPYGTYVVEYLYSPTFKRKMPYLLGVPGFGGIMFHVGNSSVDCKGCILVGLDSRLGNDWMSHSQTAMRILNDYLCNGKNVEIEVTITDKTVI